MTKIKNLSEILSTRKTVKTFNSKFFFNPDSYAERFANLFDIPKDKRKRFYDAFRIVTEGQGNELGKINSLKSSSLLSLLTFYPLFDNEDQNKGIIINDKKYYKCFFEVRNRVIKLPSCIDVVLVSKDGELLFLESKFSEYVDGAANSIDLKKGYVDLYTRYITTDVLSPLKISNEQNKTLLSAAPGEMRYIEGIKQSISHLIGLIRGPQFCKQGYYPKSYFKSYQDAYESSTKLIYGTIIFDLGSLGIIQDAFNNYNKLYSEIIGARGGMIVDAIRRWDCFMEKNNKNKTLEILPTPLTYQTIFSGDDNPNDSLLTGSIREFYGL